MFRNALCTRRAKHDATSPSSGLSATFSRREKGFMRVDDCSGCLSLLNKPARNKTTP